ncbi:putative transposase [Magnetococcus marinus MC-1]|uniref:Putative transposase n=1 Tax=Magnetococcus marinus (strain ATCC BAA-1437 / JCM 17883 / MC-1) TaxID=156889 RepID=A0LBL2_MAGMM|nr:IS91 family transposase [Magnetococcus marinus]ABK45355.1 putative transposase [Magnetococcus marinus MC-1]
MIELADVIRHFEGDYRAVHGATMLPSHHRTLDDITSCRTEALGGHLFSCDSCGTKIYAYHSCKNRHCPKCHGNQTRQWLDKRRAEMLPIPYFHITVTVPEPLRAIFRANQTDCYAILLKAAAEAIIELAKDPKHVGGTVGVLALLHTWTQQLIYHPHAHCLVTGGGLSEDGATWYAAKNGFLIPTKALARMIRGKVMSTFKMIRPDIAWPQQAWQQDWVVHCTPWGTGEQAIVDYLARYAFRIAINRERIVAFNEQTVTIRYKDRKQRRWRYCDIPGQEFLRRFLQHVLPRGFHKIRYFGLWHPSKRSAAKRVRLLLELEHSVPVQKAQEADPEIRSDAAPDQKPNRVHADAVCPACNQGRLVLLQRINRQSRSP